MIHFCNGFISEICKGFRKSYNWRENAFFYHLKQRLGKQKRHPRIQFRMPFYEI